MAPSIVLAAGGRGSSSAAPGSAPPAGRDPPGRRQRDRATGSAVEEAIDAPRVHVEEPHVHCEGGATRRELDAARGARLRRRPLAAPQPLLRRRRRRSRSPPDGVLAAAGDPRRGGARDRGRVSDRPASAPGRRDARGARPRSREAVGSEPGGLAARRQRLALGAATSGATCGRSRRHPRRGRLRRRGRTTRIVGRLSRRPRPAPGEPARRRPRADGRGAVAGAAASAARSSKQAVAWARAADVRKLELHVFPHNEPAIALYESFGFVARVTGKEHYRARAEYVDAILMAFQVPCD